MTPKDVKRTQVAVTMWILAGTVAVLIAASVGYGIGKDDTDGDIHCTPGMLVSLEVSDADEFGNGTRVLSIGDCDEIDREVFIAALKSIGAEVVTDTTTLPADDDDAGESSASSTP